LIQKATLLIIILTVTSSVVSAIDFQFDSPTSINLAENFSISISADAAGDIYDVKIFVRNSNLNIISEIYKDEWKNPYYYLKESFPAQTSYYIRLTESADSYEICARLRKTNKTNYYEECNPLSVSVSNNTIDDSQTINSSQFSNNTQSTTQDDNAEDLQPNTNENIEENKTIQDSRVQDTNISTNKIVLNSPSKSKENFSTNEENTRLWILYAFTAFCIVIIILLALRKL